MVEKLCIEEKHWIARGMGRCYGDASLGQNVLSTLKYNKVTFFDVQSGVIECQAGFTLDEVLQLAVPKGWFLPVTPGTKFVSLGGAVASDIHGKNHHKEGSFSRHTLNIKVLCGDGKIYECSRTENSDLFEATCGGMGLTGVILSVRFQLKKISTSYITQKQIKASNLDELIVLFEKYKEYTYSVAWVDCLARGKKFGRSILMLGEHSELDELKGSKTKAPLKVHSEAGLNIPFNFPSFVLNKYSIKLFNFAYYHKNLKKLQENIVHYDGFFYPLDNIRNWNRMYGKPGFLQYQFVLPLDQIDGLKVIMNRIAEKKQGSFLSVLKVFGAQNDLISFPEEGYTLALDFPITDSLLEFLDELDKIVEDCGGRIYLTKDARMNKDFFHKSYPRLEEFMQIVNKYNPNAEFKSVLSDRLSITK
ncbi:FAD-binding oxidoreductase [Fulvivirga sp. 29W222]|uniref:FAD-binding oxidoreductase n=2 Tax=Fulvivirga marina TaxID=2494733 RepID=A0A937G1R7_9BACT|nr:FAD-binding oxidoreductase [Fulvivirga marina]MBL6448903.1 FAD-binding oxidoreductase [Fulvivirga marina]